MNAAKAEQPWNTQASPRNQRHLAALPEPSQPLRERPEETPVERTDTFMARNPGMARRDFTDIAGKALDPDAPVPPEEWTRKEVERKRNEWQVLKATENAIQRDKNLATKIKDLGRRAREKGVDISGFHAFVEREYEKWKANLG